MMPSLRRVVLICAFALFSVSSAFASAQTGEPDVFIAEFGSTAIEQLTDKEASDEELEARFRELINDGFDIPLISQFVAGRYWRSATDEERDAFKSVFEDYLEQRFRPLFARYQGETFAATRVRVDEDKPYMSWVTVELHITESQIAETEWRVRHEDGDYKILDVRAEGASMAITLRDEYASVARNNGGLSGLTEVLREKIAQGAFKPAE